MFDEPGNLFTKYLTNSFLLYTQQNETMPRIGLYAQQYLGRIINALQWFKNLILVVRFFVNRYPDAHLDYLSLFKIANLNGIREIF
jgi:hypothetical protein